jgi:hypothetical protein
MAGTVCLVYLLFLSRCIENFLGNIITVITLSRVELGMFSVTE